MNPSNDHGPDFDDYGHDGHYDDYYEALNEHEQAVTGQPAAAATGNDSVEPGGDQVPSGSEPAPAPQTAADNDPFAAPPVAGAGPGADASEPGASPSQPSPDAAGPAGLDATVPVAPEHSGAHPVQAAEPRGSGPWLITGAAATVLALVGLFVWHPWSGNEPTQTQPTASPSASASSSSISGRPTIEQVRAEPHLMFASNNVFTRDVTNAPTNPQSAALITDLVKQQIEPNYGGQVAFNAYQFTASFWVADANAKRVNFKFYDCQGKKHIPAGLFDGKKHYMDVSVPADAVPAVGSDKQLAIYSPSRDKLWEFWQASKDAKGNWQACWGGRMDNVSKQLGYFPDGVGAAATGLAFVGSMVSIEEAKKKEINHAIGFNVIEPANWNDFSWPAQRSDGGTTSKGKIPEGSILRLDPSVEVDKLQLSPLGKAIARAAQKYGFIVTDKAASVAVIAEGGKAHAVLAGTPNADMWKDALDGVGANEQLNGFPWDKLQVIKKDWGKPA